ncbi:MAG: AI-2E family transporter [Acidobacteria bacterium]|nr:AI-2E family transporter [Acidobacteriota bacterium]
MLGLDARAARATWTVAVVLLALELAWLARTTILVFALAVLLAYLLSPLVQLVSGLLPARAPKVAPAALVYLAGAGAVVGAALVVGTRIVSEAAELASKLPELLSTRDILLDRYLPSVFWPYKEEIRSTLAAQAEAGKELLLPALTGLGKGLLSQLSSVIYVILVPILAFLIQLSLRDIRASVVNLFRGVGRGQLVRDILSDIDALLGLYMRAVFLLALAVFVSHTLFFGVVGVPYSALLAGVCGLLEFVPVVGWLSGMVITISVAAFAGYAHLGWLIVFFVAYRLFQDYVLQPYLYSAGIEMHPLAVLFGVLAGEHIAGITGMFFSVPLLAVLRILYRRGWEASVASPSATRVQSPVP